MQPPESAAPAPPSPPARGGAIARGFAAGIAAGLAMAVVDQLRAAPQLARFLPDGTLPLLGFLAPLYASTAALLGVALAAVLLLLLRVAPRPPLPLWALLSAGVPAAAALGGMLYGPALTVLLRFHHPGLIAALLGAAALALALPALALHQLLLGALLARRRAAPQSPPFTPLAAAPAWVAAGYALAGAVTIFTSALQHRLRMTAALRALNLALWTPAFALGALLVAVLVGRALARATAGWGRTAQRLLLVLVTLAPPAALALRARELLPLLDLRPFVTLACGAAAALLFLRLSARRPAPPILRTPWAALLLPAVLLALWGAASLMGRSDRVRKAALSQAALAGPLVTALQTVFDLDRDGFPSRWVAGGSDCDDLDPEVHPGAFDWPDDGIDQDCNGHQATLKDPAPRPPWPAAPAALPPRPNIVLITIDALRADHVGAYGYERPTTPALDALARQGFLFRNAFAHAPSTRYSVPAILTGRYPSTIAWGPPAQHWPPQVLPENHLISEMLHGRGYHTTALLSYHYFEPTWGLARGFDDYDVHLMTLHSMGGDPAATSGSSSRELADLAISKLEAQVQRGADAPFFLWVHFYDPHYRYEIHPGVPLFGGGRTEQDQYDNEIRYTDDHIARVLAALQRLGLWSRTIVAVTSDHGEGFGEHGIPRDHRHGYHLYADQTKVPLILRLPGMDQAQDQGPPRIISEPVGHVDLLPTLLNLSGGHENDEPQLLGRSLVGLVQRAAGAAQAATPARADPPYRVFQEVMYEGPTTRKALVDGRWHYIRNVVPDDTSELYDLQADPLEEHDLQGSPRVAATEEALARTLAEWMDQSALPRDFAQRVAGNLANAPIAARTPLGGRLGEYLEVTGLDLPAGPVTRGAPLEVALVLRCLRRVPPGFRLFTHLVAPSGQFLNLDHEPLDGLLPLPRLRPGQYVRDVIKLSVPANYPAGAYSLELGLFRGAERAPVSGPFSNAAQRALRAPALEVR